MFSSWLYIYVISVPVSCVGIWNGYKWLRYTWCPRISEHCQVSQPVLFFVCAGMGWGKRVDLSCDKMTCTLAVRLGDLRQTDRHTEADRQWHKRTETNTHTDRHRHSHTQAQAGTHTHLCTHTELLINTHSHSERHTCRRLQLQADSTDSHTHRFTRIQPHTNSIS